jgi:hypothetical protein
MEFRECSNDVPREVGALRWVVLLSLAWTGGEVSGVMATDPGWERTAVANDGALSLDLASRLWVTAGVRGGECTADVGGDA